MGEHRLDAFQLVQKLRSEGLKADMDHCGRSLKAQFKYANKTGAPICATLGDEEVQNGTVKLKHMQTREENIPSIGEAAEIIRKMIDSAKEHPEEK
jgi:histidyl-tRNA synthetase